MNRILAITFLLFLCLLFAVYFLFPKYADFKLLKEKVSEKESLSQEGKAYFSNLENISKNLKEYEEAVKKINSALPEKPLDTTLLSFLQKKSSENGLVLENLGQVEAFGTEAEEEVPLIKESHFSLSLVGSLSSFENFLRTLEKSSRMIEVENFSLRGAKEGFLEITLFLKVHSY